MRRFEPATRRVRRLRSSITIATFPGRNARTVSRFNRGPVYASCDGPCHPAPQGGSFRSGRRLSAERAATTRLPDRVRTGGLHGNQASQPKRVAERNYMQMNDLSKDAVNWVTVGEDGAGQRIDNYLLKLLKGVPKSHVYRILRSGEVRQNGRRAGPDARLAVGDRLRVPPIRAGAAAGRLPASGSSICRRLHRRPTFHRRHCSRCNACSSHRRRTQGTGPTPVLRNWSSLPRSRPPD